MKTATIDQIYKHYSVRKYKSDPVSDEIIQTVVAAGQRASTSSNLQTFSVIVIKDLDKRRRLMELCGNQKHIVQAPVFMAWCADQSRMARICKARNYEPVNDYVEDFLVAVVDSTLAMQTAALAAESLGLGLCYIGGIRNHTDQIIELMELPPLVFPISGMTLGWPSAKPFIRPRLPLKAVLHWEYYDTSDEEQAIQEYDRAMIATGIYKGRQIEVPGIEGEMEDYGWQEHSARRTASHIRTELGAMVRKQGFPLK